MIVYDKLLKLFAENNMTEYSLRRDNILSQESYKKIKSGTGIYQTGKVYGNKSDDPTKKRITAIDTKSIEKLCTALHCQPSDIMEVVPNTWENAERLCSILGCTKEELTERVPMEAE